LSIPIYSDPAWAAELEALAREIAGKNANAETQELARQIAEAQIDLRRVRFARYRLLSEALTNRRVQNTPEAALEQPVSSAPDLPDNLAPALSENATQLLAMDRYERRALSRRNAAIRGLDAARSASLNDRGRSRDKV
jgi:hypothetical protein